MNLSQFIPEIKIQPKQQIGIGDDIQTTEDLYKIIKITIPTGGDKEIVYFHREDNDFEEFTLPLDVLKERIKNKRYKLIKNA